MIDAALRIDPYRRIGPVDPMIYGQFIEHLGRCIYGGLFEPGSPLSDERGYRRDVLEAARRLRPPILRWPGGNFVSGYHWQDGVGPAEERPATLDRAWRKPESNRFGTDEFIEYCRLLGTEAYICVNTGTGSMDEAAAWVEYCNGQGESRYAELRRRHGYADPHNVIYWGLGNEVYGPWQIGQKPAAEYAEQAREFAKLMSWTDGRIKLVACGAHDPEWDWEVLKAAGRYVDYISVHAYFRPQPEEPYYSLLAWPAREERYVRDLWHLIDAARRRYRIQRPIRIAFDEWNSWHRTFPAAVREDPLLDEQYDLTDALCVAAFLNMLHRNCQAIGIANMAQMVNVLAPIITRPDGLLLQTIYYPLVMQREHSGPLALDVWVESDTFETAVLEGESVGYLDASATIDEAARRLYISCVNLHREEGLRLALHVTEARVAPEGTRYTVDGPDVTATNTFEKPDTVTMTEQPLSGLSGQCTLELPPHSAHVVELSLG